MTASTRSDLRQSLRRAAVQATLAASVHNSQPWRFVLGDDSLEIHADFRRQLPVVDPAGRQLMISCGCALLNARVSLAAHGYRPWVQRLPDPTRPDLVARLLLTMDGGSCEASGVEEDPYPHEEVSSLAALDGAVALRRTGRRPFAADRVPEELLEALERTAASEAAVLSIVRARDDSMTLATLRRRAQHQQSADPAYRAELRAWTSEDWDTDGDASGPSLGSVTAPGARPETTEPDVETSGEGRSDGSGGSRWLLLGTTADTAAAWIRAGEGLERLLLEVTSQGFSAMTLTQVLEIPAIREELRRELRLPVHPHLLLHIGRAAPTPAPRRRRLVDMLSDST